MSMTTPLVTVPVEPTEAMMRAWHRSAWPQGPEVSPMSQAGLAFKRHYAAMLSASPAPEGGAVAWACKTCNSPRAVDPCQKCGTALTKPADGWEWPGLPDIDRIRRLAREVGYAVGVHGTMERDLDLIAAPWVAEAVGPAELAQHIADGLGGEVVNGDNQDKPCGRWSCNIHTPDWTKLIDLSVMPPITHPAPDVLRVAVEALEKIKAVRVCKESANIWTGADACRKIATEALAALQADQKGGEA